MKPLKGLRVEYRSSLEETVEQLCRALEDEGYGILSRFDSQVCSSRFVILRICFPRFASSLLLSTLISGEHQSEVSLLTAVIQEVGFRKVIVEIHAAPLERTKRVDKSES